MKKTISRAAIVAALILGGASAARAHLGYGGRDFGIYEAATPKFLNISGQTVASNFGWADGTDADFGDSHRLRIFKFTLADPMEVTVSVAGPEGFLPGFSIYSGLASSIAPDHDGADITIEYLLSLGGKEGAFNALETFKIGNDVGTSFDTMTTFTYVGHAADGTSANFGSTPGIWGDGLADGFVTRSFALPAGNYSFFVGGANYAGQSPTPDATAYPISVTVSSVPEPGSAVAIASGLAALCAIRRRRT